MKYAHAILASTLSILIAAPLSPNSLASVAWSARQVSVMESKSPDVPVSSEGKSALGHMLVQDIRIYGPALESKDGIGFGIQLDRMEVRPNGGTLVAKTQKESTVQETSPQSAQDDNLSFSPFKGKADAPVVISVFSDFQCPACARLAPVLDQVLEKYPDEVKLVFKNFPLPGHKYAKMAALAAFAARRQGKFWEFHDRLFANFDKLSDVKLLEITQELGLDPERLEKDMQDLVLVAEINKDIRLGARVGVKATPTVFINGRIAKRKSLEELQVVVEQELERAKK